LKAFQETVTQEYIVGIFIKTMMKEAWASYYNLFDKGIGENVKKLLSDEEAMKCLTKARMH